MSKKKKSSSSKSSFDPKNFFIMHVEKLVFAFITMLAGLVVYSGFSTKPFSSAKTPQKLQEQAKQVSQNLKKDHWNEMMTEEGRNVAPVFVIAASESRKPLDPIQYGSDIGGTSSIKPGARRSDPVLAAPAKLEAHYFFGAIARSANADPLETLEDAKKPEVKAPKPGNTAGGALGSQSGGAGLASGSGMPSGAGMTGSPAMGGGTDGFGGMGGDPLSAGRRLLSAGYDRGYRFGMRTFLDTTSSMGQTNYMMDNTQNPLVKPDVVPKKVIAVSKGFVSVTALAPHEEMESSYRKEFYSVLGYMEGRDTPNYVGFEAQRVEIIDPNKEIEESDWKPLPDASPNNFKELAKKLPGTCSEVHLPNWVEPNISMPIPPVLLTDYRKYASHSEIPTGAFEESESASMSGMAGGYPGAAGGMQSDGGFTEASAGGMGSGSMGMAGMAGIGGMSGPGGMGGMSGPGGMGGSGYPGGMGGMGGSGYPGGGGMGGYSDGGMSGIMDVPKKLPSTKYKLVRFYDFSVLPGKVYKYRVRLLMYDPNYPEWTAIKPASSTLSNEVLKRVRALESQEPKDAGVATKPQSGSAAPIKRASRRETEWSAPSMPVLTAKPASVYVAKGEEKLECVFVDFDAAKGISVPRKENLDNLFSRGLVFGTPTKVKGREAPVEVIHPVKRVIKALKDFKTTNFVTIVDIKGYAPLTMGTSKDPIKTGAEVVSFDPLTGQLVVSREFDNFTNFHMYLQPDLPAVGPLGGGLTIRSAGVSGYGAGDAMGGEMDGSMGPAGMNPGMGGPGGMNPGGSGSSPGGSRKGPK